jgi:dihydrolipoamide dehydrogenase
MTNIIETEVVVIGSGPGGYSSAFRAADLGKKVVLIEKYDNLGGVCLNVGCIPSKALLHIAKVINEAEDMGAHGVAFGKPNIDIAKMRDFKKSVIAKLTVGLKMMAKQRKVAVMTGTAKFTSSHELEVVNASGETTTIKFQNAVIAVGSKPVKLPFLPNDSRIFDSTGALELANPTGKMLVLGGGIIGLEMATVYSALGAEVTIVEMQSQIIPGCDPDLVKPLEKRLGQKCEIMVNTKLLGVEARADGLYAKFEGAGAPTEAVRFDQMLVAVGRVPNGREINAEAAGVKVDERGFIPVDRQMKTSVDHIYAIGDVVGQPMLAHKAVPEGRLAAEVIAGKKHYFDAKCIPSVAYTDPEVAWVGLTETEAKRDGIKYEKGSFPWMASGRALAVDRSEGMTKVLFDPETHRVLGGGIVGVNAGDMISELGLAIEMCCEAEDIALTIHPHPTFAESIMLATEMFEGTITDLYAPKKKQD